MMRDGHDAEWCFKAIQKSARVKGGAFMMYKAHSRRWWIARCDLVAVFR